MVEVLTVLVPIFVAAIAGVGGWLNGSAQRQEAKSTGTLGLVDRWEKLAEKAEARSREAEQQVEELRRDLREKLALQDKRIDSLQHRDRVWKLREGVWVGHVDLLEKHIELQLPPPAPPLPELLLRDMSKEIEEEE